MCKYLLTQVLVEDFFQIAKSHQILFLIMKAKTPIYSKEEHEEKTEKIKNQLKATKEG